MGFAVMPEPIKNGVYIFKPYGDLVLVTSTFWFINSDVFYKPRQRKPKMISQLRLQDKKLFEYLGEL